MDERGKFAWQNVAIIGLVAIIVAVWMGWIDLPDGEGDSGISLYLQTTDGQLVPINGEKTLSIQALSLYYGSTRIQGVTGILKLKPTLSTGDDVNVAIHWTGDWKITGFIKNTNTQIFSRSPGYWPKAPDPTNIPTNVWTTFSEYPASFTEPELPTLADGDYTFVWAANGAASYNELSANWSVLANITIRKAGDTLSIVEEIGTSTFDTLG